MQNKLPEQKQLERLEEAAEATSSPEQIQYRASHTEERLKPSHFWFLPFLLVGVVFGGALLYLERNPSWLAASWNAKLHRYLIGALAADLVLAAMRAVEIYVIARIGNRVSQFNLKRVLRLLVGLGLVLIAVSVLFVNWYAAVVSLGLISLILGFALQTPISSFIGWIYILARRPYRVGDRIEMEEYRGDVIDVSYLDTTLWEIGGRHLSTDHPSGRLIKFPNAKVLNNAVINYSWPLFPYIWNEVKFHVAYESDLEFVARTMQRVAEAELGRSMKEKVRLFRDLLARTPVDQLQVREHPAVLFRVSDNTWLEVIVRYLVNPKESGRVKTQLTRKLLDALNKQPDKVLFPKSNAR